MPWRTFGVMALFTGTLLVLWVGYNVFIERQPATIGLSILRPVFLTSVLYYFGWTWLTGCRPGETSKPRSRSQESID